MTLAEILRSINLILSLIVLVWLLLRRIQHPKWYPRGGLRRDIWSMALCWDFALIVGTIEQLAGTGTYIRVVLSMAAILTTMAILVRPKQEWPGTEEEETKDALL